MIEPEDLENLYISLKRDYIVAELKSGRRIKILAPLKENFIGQCFLVMNRLFQLYGFKIEERRDKIVPHILSNVAAPDDPGFALPTRSLFAHSSKRFPTLNILCRYMGNGIFRQELTLDDEHEEKIDELISNIDDLYKKALVRFKKQKILRL